VVQLLQVSGHGQLVRLLAVDHVLRIQQRRNVQLLLGQSECVSVVFADIFRVERLVIKEIWSEVVDDGVEGQAVPEGSGQVGDVNVGVVGSHLAAPDLERSQSFDLNRRHHFVVNHLFLIR